MSDTESQEGASRFVGKLMQAWFTTEADLEAMLPPTLEFAGDPNRAFIKVYELKTRRQGRDILQPAHSQYKQTCVSTLVRPKGTDLEPMHHNFFMWEARGWAMGTGGLAWNKKHAEIEQTSLWPIETRYPEFLPQQYRVDIRDFDAAIMSFRGEIDGKQTIEAPPLNGFYIPDNSDESFVYNLVFLDSALENPLWGSTASLEFGYADYEVDSAVTLRDSRGRPIGRAGAGVLGKVDVEGFVVHDVMFLRKYGAPEKIVLP
jgi:hypothetical protein